MPALTLRRAATVLLISLVATGAADAQLTFRGASLPAIEVEVAKSSGLDKVYVLPYTQGVEAVFEMHDSGPVSWQRFSKLGGGYAEDVASTQAGNQSILSRLEGNMGYIITLPDGRRQCYWIVNYSSFPLDLKELTLSPESDCSTTWLNLSGTAEPITAYGINGSPLKISRELELTYTTLEFSSEAFAYIPVTKTETVESASEAIHCSPSLCQTDFTLSGDRFARIWGEEQTVTSPIYDPVAVEAHTEATQTEREVDNEVGSESSSIGGSAPAEITFRAAVTDAALYHEWEVARDREFNQTFLRYNDLEFTRTFTEQGTFYVRLLAANSAGACEWESDTYEVSIGESSLKCPNAFSPGSSEGVNDEWKVSYKSIIEFDCQIFDRQGRRMARLTDPSQGWDGRYQGKLVSHGVYFYVIRAKGADGQEYKLNGNINIIGYKRNTSTNNDATQGL